MYVCVVYYTYGVPLFSEHLNYPQSKKPYEEFHRKTRYIKFGQFEIFEI